jgi:molybdopterin converting factor small subunit
MSVTVRIPSQLRPMTGGLSEVSVEQGTVREVLSNLELAHGGIEARLMDEQGSLRRHVNLFLADQDVRFLDGLDTPVPDGFTLSIVPAVAGG